MAINVVAWVAFGLLAPRVPISLLNAIKLELPSFFLYFFCIVRVATLRAEDPTAVLGQREKVSDDVEIAIRVLNNTTEQLILGVGSRLILATTVNNFWAQIFVTSLWISGRVLFILGYTKENPMGREFGFDLTFLTSLVCLIVSVLSIFFGLFA